MFKLSIGTIILGNILFFISSTIGGSIISLGIILLIITAIMSNK